jgi:hypothetical protein
MAHQHPLPITIEPKALIPLCQHHHIRKLALFGSVLRDDFRADSDVDILVEFEPGHIPGFDFIEIQDKLAAIIGRTIELNTPQDLSRYFRDQVIAEAQVIYAQP